MADLIDRNAAIQMLSDYAETQQDLDYYRDMLMKIPAVNRWISVEDALPDAFLYVICAGGDGMAILRYNGKVWVDDAGCMYPMSAITHWMPLPEIPEHPTTERKNDE